MVELIEKMEPTDFVVKAVSWVVGEIGSAHYADDE
jgi:hypothetical protein